jgi:hypothetical protein
MPKSMLRLIENIVNWREVFVRKDKRISFFLDRENWCRKEGLYNYKNKNMSDI